MTKTESQLRSTCPTNLSPDPTEVLIPEARRQARWRRLRNLVLLLVIAALVVGLVAWIGSDSPSRSRLTGTGSGPSPASPSADASAVTPKEPVALAVGPNGELYIADIGRQQILRRLPNGHFEVVAGTGVAGYSGDGGPATKARLNGLDGLAVAPNGAIFFTQTSAVKGAFGLPGSVVREIAPGGKITTIVGQDPNCGIVPASATSLPAKFAEIDGASLTISADGLLDISTTVCPNVLTHLGSFLQLTASGMLVQTAVDAIPDTSGYCGGGIAGTGFIAFDCSSGAGHMPRLMVVRPNGTSSSYPNVGSQSNPMVAANGSVVAIHNEAVVRVSADALMTIASPSQIAKLVAPSAMNMGEGGIATDRQGTVYFDQDFLIGRRGCSSVIFAISPNGRLRQLYRSPSIRSCY